MVVFVVEPFNTFLMLAADIDSEPISEGLNAALR